MRIWLVVLSFCAAGRIAAQPVINAQPQAEIALIGSNVILQVSVSDPGPFTCQWRLNGTNLPNVITTVAGNGTNGFTGDGQAATNAEISPAGLSTDAVGDLFFADSNNNRIRKINPAGTITTVAGTNSPGFSGDGAPAIFAKLYGPAGVTCDGAGNLYIADTENDRIRQVFTNGLILTVAGGYGNGFYGDGGAATNAGLFLPSHVALDSTGNLYIADQQDSRIRLVSTNGLITTFAGTNSIMFSGDGGAAAKAALDLPASVAVDSAGNVFIADTYHNRIRKVNPNGIISTVAGNASQGFSGDFGTATNAGLYWPNDVAVDGMGNLFIADAGHYRIRKVDCNGIITTVAGNGSRVYSGDNGVATNAGMYAYGVAVDASGNLFIADNGRIRKVSLNDTSVLKLISVNTNNAGNYDVIITDSSGSVTSSVAPLSIVFPPSLGGGPLPELVTNGAAAAFTVDVSGTPPLAFQWQKDGVNLADSGNVSGSATTNLTLGAAGPADAGFYALIITNPYGCVTSGVVALTVVSPPVITLQPTNQVVADGGTVSFLVGASGTAPLAYQWRLNGTNLPANAIITTVAGNGTNGFTGNGGPATNAELSSPEDLAVDAAGNLFIADSGNDQVRKVDQNGVITTVAGSGSYTSSGDGGPATSAGFDYVSAVAIDSSNNLLIADEDAGRIRRVNASGIIATVAGTGLGYSGDGAAATNAQMSFVSGITVDVAGNIFVADNGNSVVRKINTAGVISTLASIPSCYQVAVDQVGNVFVGTEGTEVFKVDVNGVVSVVAGDGSYGYSGDGGAATNASLFTPCGVAVDLLGNLFVADYHNERIRQVNDLGIITTLAGKSGNIYYGNGGLAMNAVFRQPNGLAVDPAGNLFIADQGNACVRKINLAGSPVLTLQDVSPTNALLDYSPPTNSVFVGLNGSGVPAAGNISVVVTSPYGAITSSVVALTVVLAPQNLSAGMIGGSGLSLKFTGTPGYTYSLQSTTNLISPVIWRTVASSPADAHGNWSFIDANAAQCSQRFYRASSE